jgi:hypothetical protein
LASVVSSAVVDCSLLLSLSLSFFPPWYLTGEDILKSGEIENKEPVQAVLPWIAPEVLKGLGSSLKADVFRYLLG